MAAYELSVGGTRGIGIDRANYRVDGDVRQLLWGRIRRYISLRA